MRLNKIIPLAVFVVIVSLLGVGLAIDSTRVPSPLIGKEIPTFTLTEVSAPERQVAPEQFRGQVWLLNVWATWCAACKEEHEVLMSAAGDHDVTVVGLNYKDRRNAAVEWLRTLGDPYVAVAFDPNGRAGLDLGVYGVPETYVIDREGIIRHKHIGPISLDELDNRLLPLVEGLRAEG
jgi:cytochrome c biogenesis protein CcmG/thiol:disulfide interchange protein DsbE